MTGFSGLLFLLLQLSAAAQQDSGVPTDPEAAFRNRGSLFSAPARRPEFLSSSEFERQDPDPDSDAEPEADQMDDWKIRPGTARLPDCDSESSLLSEIGHEAWCAEPPNAGESGTSACHEPEFVRHRNGFYQGTSLGVGWLHDDPDDGLQVTTLDVAATFAVPLGSMENLLLFTPYLRADELSAAAALDVPDAVYDTGLKALWKRPINDRWSSLLMVTPSVRSDFETSDSAFRLFGLGLITWQWIPETLAVSGGTVYTGREDFPILPAFGLLWTPEPDLRLDLQFPSPRLSRRISRNPGVSETWTYLSGVFGGNTWAVTRNSGQADELTIRDLRLMAGVEHLRTRNCGAFFEAGFVFNRSLEYTNVPFERELDSTWVVRTGLSF